MKAAHAIPLVLLIIIVVDNVAHSSVVDFVHADARILCASAELYEGTRVTLFPAPTPIIAAVDVWVMQAFNKAFIYQPLLLPAHRVV